MEQPYLLPIHVSYSVDIIPADAPDGDLRSQDISRHGMQYWPPKPEYSISSIRKVNMLVFFLAKLCA